MRITLIILLMLGAFALIGCSSDEVKSETTDSAKEQKDEANIENVKYFIGDTEVDKEEVKGKEHRVCAYDADGNETSENYFDVDGNPVAEYAEVHRIESSHDSERNKISSSSFGADGKPTGTTKYLINGEGVSKDETKGKRHKVVVFDADSNVTSMSHFGADGNPAMDSKQEYHRTEYEYDAAGNIEVMSFFGTDGKPCANKALIHRAEYTYDDAGNQTSIRCFYIDGNLIYEKAN